MGLSDCGFACKMCYLRGWGEGVEADIAGLWGTGAEEGGRLSRVKRSTAHPVCLL